MSNDGEAFIGCIGLLIGIVILYFFVVYVVFPTIVVFSSAGALFGGGVSVRNYIRSFRKNVAFETV